MKIFDPITNIYSQAKSKIPFLNELLFYCLLFISSILWGMGQYTNFFFIRFFGMLPFLYIILNRKKYLLESLIFGWIAYIINFYWFYITFRESGKLPLFFAVFIPLLLCLYYSLQYPLIAYIYKKFFNYNKKLFYSFPVIFVFVDFLYPKLFTHSIADSQIGFYYFIQFIDITGMTGLILIIMFFNIGLYKLIEIIVKNKRIRIYNFIFIIPFILAITYGVIRVGYLENKAKKLPNILAAMIQGNITGKQKMDEKYYNINVNRYNELTKKAVEDLNPDLIIWPESVFTRSYDGSAESLKKLIFDNYPPLILGITFWKTNRPTNSCFLIEKRQEKQRYDKKHLLMFGEYIPFEKTFPFLKKLTPLNYGMRKGSTSSIFIINKKIKASMSICFEDIFPDEIRKKTNEESNLMINITNDSWYGKGLGPVHHSILGRLRAIENRRSFYRCTATGLTTASDLTGKVVTQGKMWEPEYIYARLALNPDRTIYNHIGETFSFICVILVIILILVLLRKHFLSKEKKFVKHTKGIHILKRYLQKKRKIKLKIIKQEKTEKTKSIPKSKTKNAQKKVKKTVKSNMPKPSQKPVSTVKLRTKSRPKTKSTIKPKSNTRSKPSVKPKKKK